MSKPCRTVGSWRSNSIQECLDAVASKMGTAGGSSGTLDGGTYPREVVRGPSKLIVSTATDSVLKVTPMLALGDDVGSSTGGTVRTGRENHRTSGNHSRAEVSREGVPSVHQSADLWANILSGVKCLGDSAPTRNIADSEDDGDNSSQWSALQEAPCGVSSDGSSSWNPAKNELGIPLEFGNQRPTVWSDMNCLDDDGLSSSFPRCDVSLTGDSGTDSFHISYDNGLDPIDEPCVAGLVDELDSPTFGVRGDPCDSQCIDGEVLKGDSVQSEAPDSFDDLTIEDIDALLAADENLLSRVTPFASCSANREHGSSPVKVSLPNISRNEKKKRSDGDTCYATVRGSLCEDLSQQITDGRSHVNRSQHDTGSQRIQRTTDRRAQVQSLSPVAKTGKPDFIHRPVKEDNKLPTRARSRGSFKREHLSSISQKVVDAGIGSDRVSSTTDVGGRVRVSTLRSQPTPQRSVTKITTAAKAHQPFRGAGPHRARVPASSLKAILPTQPMGEDSTHWAGLIPQGRPRRSTGSTESTDEPSHCSAARRRRRGSTVQATLAEARTSQWRPIGPTQPMDNTVASVVLEATQSMDEEVETFDAKEANGRIDGLCISRTRPLETSPERPGSKKRKTPRSSTRSSTASQGLSPTQPMKYRAKSSFSIPPTQPMAVRPHRDQPTLDQQRICLNAVGASKRNSSHAQCS